jgi:FKBP-type peptidyl-prolyl cis-trans isomerase
MKYVSIAIVIIFSAVVIGFWVKKAPSETVMNNEQITQEKSTETQEEVLPEELKKEDKKMESNKRLLPNFTVVTKTDSLKKIDLIVGTGQEVKPGDTVSVHYTGAVAATGEVFQSSKDFGTDPITFPLSGVIKGWTDGIPGMKIGGTRRLVIPAAQAYGATPPPGSGIPANADLVFDVELIAIK